jgi:ribosome biogenesis GTPase
MVAPAYPCDMPDNVSLARWGWQPCFQRQLSPDEWEHGRPARVISQERSVLEVAGADFSSTLPLLASMPAMTVGDWVLLDANLRFLRLLERSSLFARKAAGTGVAAQLIAANVDTLFIVSSLNQDFNPSRIERYLVLAHEARVQALVVLTKEDLCADPSAQLAQAHALGAGLVALAVNALDAQSVRKLAPWCGPGQTVALMGSSGVGKSTLVNTLLGNTVQATQAIREDDAKGRHTTTRRSLHPLVDGGVLLDTPGMRELQLFACEQGIEEAFADVAALASACRFADCAHGNEPGCAVRAAVAAGTLDARRLDNYDKLLREQQRNTATLGEQRARERQLGRQHRWAKFTHARKRKADET